MQEYESYSYELFDIEGSSYSYYDSYSYGFAQDFSPVVDKFESVTSLDVSASCVFYQTAS